MEKKNNALSHAVQQAVTESLENMVFMAVESVPLFWGKVQIIQPCPGAITVVFPEHLVKQFAGALHADASSNGQSTGVCMDIVAEMTNTIAGRIMNLLIPDDQEYEISLPKTGRGDVEYQGSACYMKHFEINGVMYAVIVEGNELLEYRRREPQSAPTTAAW